jgi:hypothetical protein
LAASDGGDLFNKKPAIVLAIAGFSKFYFVYALEVPSHDADAASAMPLGRLSIDSLAAQANIHDGLHHVTAAN